MQLVCQIITIVALSITVIAQTISTLLMMRPKFRRKYRRPKRKQKEPLNAYKFALYQYWDEKLKAEQKKNQFNSFWNSTCIWSDICSNILLTSPGGRSPPSV